MSDKARVCTHCNGTGHIEMVDLGDGMLLTPEQAKSRREADARIMAEYEEGLRYKEILRRTR